MKWKKMTKQLLITGGILGSIWSFNGQITYAHGYVESPPSRGYQGLLDEQALGWESAYNLYGDVITNPQGLENKKGFPESGPADGHIASAEIGDRVLDNQTADRWKKTTLNTGPNSFTWHYTAAHSTTKWHYYMTKQGWDPNKPLTRDSLQLIGEITHDGTSASNNLTHTLNIPEDRSGYHVILAVWDVADTPNAFYNVIDVNVVNNGLASTIPEKPINVQAENVTDSSMTLTWDSQTAAEKYNVYQNSKKVTTVTTNSFDAINLDTDTAYAYRIEAVSYSGLTSEKSDELTVKTLPKEDIQLPTTPKGLHSMKETESEISLMWSSSTHKSGIKNYEVYRDGHLISESAITKYQDKGLEANKEYIYTVKAISNSGEVSKESEPITVKTKEHNASSEDGIGEWKVGTLTLPEVYTAGETIIYHGKLFKVVQTHNNYGDENWSPELAESLFTGLE